MFQNFILKAINMPKEVITSGIISRSVALKRTTVPKEPFSMLVYTVNGLYPKKPMNMLETRMAAKIAISRMMMIDFVEVPERVIICMSFPPVSAWIMTRLPLTAQGLPW